MTWHRISRDHYRTACSRFTVWRAWAGRWVAVDADAGRVRRFGTKAEAKQWCEQQQGER